MTEIQQRDLEICRWLTGDRYYRRAVRECECKNHDIEILGIKCKSSPEICGGCNGTGEVFREAAFTNSRKENQ